MPTVYTLLIGINEYSPLSVSKKPRSLYGCLNDVTILEQSLGDFVNRNSDFSFQSKRLENEDATRDQVIRTFRSFLSKQAQDGDVVFYHFSGHGSYESAPDEFQAYSSGGKLETQILYDSRESQKRDLADKELAVLLSEIAEGVTIVVSLDCCYSGSGTRNNGVERYSDGIDRKRALSDFIGDVYQTLPSGAVVFPESNYIVFTSSSKDQVTGEFWVNKTTIHGAHSYGMIRALELANRETSYFDLFQKMRLFIDSHLNPLRIKEGFVPQVPRLEVNGDTSKVNKYNSFLFNEFKKRPEQINVRYTNDSWVMDQGILQGLNKESLEDSIEIYHDKVSERSIGKVKITHVGLYSSVLLSEIELDASHIYVTDPILNPIPVFLSGDDENRVDMLRSFLKQSASNYLIFHSEPYHCTYHLHIQHLEIALRRNIEKKEKLLFGVSNWTEQIFPYLRQQVKKIHTYESLLKIGSQNSDIPNDQIEWSLHVQDAVRQISSSSHVYIPIQKTEGEKIPFHFTVTNLYRKSLYAVLIYLGPEYETQIHYKENFKLGPTSTRIDGIKYPAREKWDMQLYLPKDKHTETMTFILLLSEEFIGDEIDFDNDEVIGLQGIYGQIKEESELLGQKSTRGVVPIQDIQTEHLSTTWKAVSFSLSLKEAD